MNPQKEQYNAAKERYYACKESVYKDYPQVEKFEKTKKRLLKTTLILCLILTLSHIYTIQNTASYNIFLVIIMSFLKTDWIFLLAAGVPKWKVALGLYILTFSNISDCISSLTSNGVTSFEELVRIYSYIFHQFPLVAVSDALAIIYMILVLIFAIWLTVPSKNREMAELSEQLNMKISDLMKANTP